MTEKTDAQRVDEAERAARFLADPIITEILTEIREDAISNLIGSREGREDNIALINAVELLRDALKSRVTTGSIAAGRGR